MRDIYRFASAYLLASASGSPLCYSGRCSQDRKSVPLGKRHCTVPRLFPMDPRSVGHEHQQNIEKKGGANEVNTMHYHGVSPACSGLRVLSSCCCAYYIGLSFDGTASEENLPMGCSSPDSEGAWVRQHIRSSCPQNLCDFRKPNIITSQKTHCT